MAFKDRIKEARLNNKLTQEQLAEKIGVAKSTLAGYEKGNREPNLETTIKIMTVLGIDANYLWQDEMDFPMKVSYEEMEHIEKYRDLDDHGKEMVDFTLNKEHERSIKNTDKITESIVYDFKMRNLPMVAEDSCPYGVKAAHKRTDIDVTDEMVKHDDDIMDDDNF